MNRIIVLLVATALLSPAFACSGKNPPELIAVRSKNTLTALRELNDAYEKKNQGAFMAAVAPDYQDRGRFSKEIESVFSKYETIHFHIQYTRMLILVEEQGRTRATFNWDADWLTAGGSLVKDGGRVTLVFEPEHFTLLSVEGKNPFVPQPGEIPGNK